ncbi:hypothetical protein BJV82DRAFT_46238 [Fennellomyces sp. T-0311]|nr:hypothetical protein BJV82DRAFT_46238 [Fennellomyces sp. T-0311]
MTTAAVNSTNCLSNTSRDLNALLFKFKLIDPSSHWNSRTGTRAKLWSTLESTVSAILMGTLSILQDACECQQQQRPYQSSPWIATQMISITHASAQLSSITRSLTDTLQQHAQEMTESSKMRSTAKPKTYRLDTSVYFRNKVTAVYEVAHKIKREVNSILQQVQDVEALLLQMAEKESFNLEQYRETIQYSLITHTNQLVEALLEFSASPSIIVVEKKFAADFEHNGVALCVNQHQRGAPSSSSQAAVTRKGSPTTRMPNSSSVQPEDNMGEQLHPSDDTTVPSSGK